MGEHRVSIKISFEMHGHKAEQDSWVNWSDDVPQRWAEWIEAQHEKAMDRYLDAQFKDEERRAAERENAERLEFERLKAKFGNA
jgi:hypothetical protein